MIDAQPMFENEFIKEQTVFIPDSLYFFHNYSIQDMANFYASIYAHWNQERFQQLSGFQYWGKPAGQNPVPGHAATGGILDGAKPDACSDDIG